MNQDFLEFLTKTVGISPAAIEAAIAENSTFDPNYAQTWANTNKSIVLDKHGEPFFQKKMADAFSIRNTTVNQAINKAFELGMSRDEAGQIELEKLLGMAKIKVDEIKAEASSKTDAKLREEVETWKTGHLEWKNKYETLSEKSAAEIAQEKERANIEINDFYVKNTINSATDEMKWGIDHKQVPFWKEKIVVDLMSKYKIEPDGRMFGKSGGDAVNHDGNGVYNNVHEAVQYMFVRHNLGKANNNGEGAAGTPKPNVSATDIKVPQYILDMEEKARKAAEKGQRRQ